MNHTQDTQFDFLHQFIQRALDDAGFQNLTEQTRAEYIPQFAAEAERRIGLALIPRLSPESAEELTTMLADDAVTPEQLREFWKRSVPDFEHVVERTLNEFSKELQDTLANIS